MFASLPMYDLPEIRPSTDALWGLIRDSLADHGIGTAPEALLRGGDPHHDWLRDDLVVSQTCGLPFVRELKGRVQMLGSPSYDIECGSGSYYSVIVTGNGVEGELADISGRRMACNDLRSQSGFAAMLTHLQREGLPLPGKLMLSGAHLSSIELVARGEADFASIDAVTFMLARRHLQAARSVRVIGKTEPMPALPYITSARFSLHADAMRQAISEAVAGLGESDRDALLMTGFVARQESDYQPIAEAWDVLERSGLAARMAERAV